MMGHYTIPTPEVIHQEILASHERCRQYGIDPFAPRNLSQSCLNQNELTARRKESQTFLDIATAQTKELYRFAAGAGFAVTIADNEGYILEVIGDQAMVDYMRAGNCSPGYRWSERDVGTSVISLVLERKFPFQVHDDEHFCERGHGFTCSASPVFGEQEQLLGIIAISGNVNQVHPHTLGMVITAAHSIEKQMRILQGARELLLRNNYLNAILESIDIGVMAINRHGIITQINNHGRRILKVDEELEGQPLSALLGTQVNVKQMMQAGFGYTDREVFIRAGQRDIQVVNTAKPIFDEYGEVQGIIIVFNELKRIRKLVNAMVGSEAKFTFDHIIGESQGIQSIKNLARQASTGDSTILIQGETGTGKELFAQSIHNESTRKHAPFMAINCGAIPRELLESELYGYAGGAFTGAVKGGRPGKFELASGGTVFLDEIGDMPADMQVKLLRVLQTGEITRIGEHKTIPVNIRIIAATHVNLKQEVERGNFRKDLFYRLNVFPICVPPLRDRAHDILLLAQEILERRARSLKKSRLTFSPEAEQTLCAYHWPGNIRELENAVERAINLVKGHLITPDLFGLPEQDTKRAPLSKQHHGTLLEEVEKQTINDVMEEVQGNISKASGILGITRATLYKKLRKYELQEQKVKKRQVV